MDRKKVNISVKFVERNMFTRRHAIATKNEIHNFKRAQEVASDEPPRASEILNFGMTKLTLKIYVKSTYTT